MPSDEKERREKKDLWELPLQKQEVKDTTGRQEDM